MLVIHGTTKELSFVTNSFKKSSCWSCSESDQYVYVWNPESYSKEFDEEYAEPAARDFHDNSDILSVVEAFRYAKDSAYTQAAFTGIDTTCIVYVLDMPDSLLEADTSCPNMENALRFRKSDFDANWIVGVYVKDFSAYSSPFLVANLLRNEYFNDTALDSNLYKIAKAVYNTPSGFDSLYCDLVEELQENWTYATELVPLKLCTVKKEDPYLREELYF